MNFNINFASVLCVVSVLLGNSAAAEDRADVSAAAKPGPEAALAAAELIQLGKVYSLAQVTGPDTPAVQGRTYAVEVMKIPGGGIGTNKLTGLDDRLVSHVGIGSHIDSLAHIGIGGIHFGGRPVDSFYRPEGVTALGAETIPPIVTRGMLLDMAALLGVDIVPADSTYDAEMISAALERQDIQIRSGDVVIFHSGWGRLVGRDNERWLGAHPGPDANGARFLANAGVVAIGADTPSLELVPSNEEGKLYPVHQLLLVENGIYILEGLATAGLAADQVYEFAFVLGVPRLGGAVQAPVNPVAIR